MSSQPMDVLDSLATRRNANKVLDEESKIEKEFVTLSTKNHSKETDIGMKDIQLDEPLETIHRNQDSLSNNNNTLNNNKNHKNNHSHSHNVNHNHHHHHHHHSESKLRSQDGHLNNHSTKIDGDKKLSFVNGDDDDSENERSSPSSLEHKPISKKWTLINEADKLKDGTTDSNAVTINKNSTETVTKTIKEYEIINEDELDLAKSDDDASSTSSCSCEDHSSVVDPSDDLHEALDYDEDSITDSPPGTSNNTTQEPIYPSTSSSSKPVNKLASPTSFAVISVPKEEMEDFDLARLKGLASAEDDSKEHDNKDEVKNLKTRIKSVINFNHVNDSESTGSKKEETDKFRHRKSHKSYQYLLKYFFKDACYFQIKSINHENVELSKSMGVWSTPIQNEIRLNTAFQDHRNVILIFSVQQSGGFQGFARMVSESRPTTKPIPWVLPERLSKNSLGGVIKVEWLCTKELPFHDTQELFNPYNENKPVKIARDGQQVEPKIGKKLCRLFPRDSKEKLLSSISTLKRQTSQRKKSSHRIDNLYPLDERHPAYMDERHRQGYLPIRGVNGLDGEVPILPGHISHEFNAYGSFGKAHGGPMGGRRMVRQQGPGIYQRQNMHLSHQFQTLRSYHTSRAMDGAPRSLMPPYSHLGFHQNLGYDHSTNHHHHHHQYANPYDSWTPNMEMNRYHPYQRSRR